MRCLNPADKKSRLIYKAGRDIPSLYRIKWGDLILLKYENLTLDEERALYAVQDAEIIGCTFSGPADGESALKECRNIQVKGCTFQLRYPFWHVRHAVVEHCTMTETCRAALWYDNNITLTHCTLGGIKALRECKDIVLDSCAINSTEFGWFCDHLHKGHIK